MFRKKSKTQLGNDIKEMIHDLYVGCLDRAEKILRPNLNSQEWGQFRFEVLNMGNGALRDVPAILEDYQIEFRPPIFRVEYKMGDIVVNSLVDLPGVHFMWTQKGQPELIINTGKGEKGMALADNLKLCLQCGGVFIKDEAYLFVVTGIWDIYNKVIPFCDEKKPFRGSALPNYIEWKERVIENLC